ncbi:MAG TPA: putative porin, partial [Candidatus Binatia bacterium]|nr:putative porin [Candidatus Binatia bacterium]
LFAASIGRSADSSDSSDLLLNLFIEKGYVSKQEAEKVKEEAAKRQAELDQFKAEAEEYKTQLDQVKSEMAEFKARSGLAGQTNIPGLLPPAQWKINKGVVSMELFGNVRVRYEDRQAKDPSGGKIDLQRERYAVRFGLRGTLLDDAYFGFRVDTSSNPRSSWVTFGTSSSGTYQGPYGKSNAGINIGQVYLGWRPADWVDITLGKMPNPLYTTCLVWDGDINPEGAAERFKYTVGDADLFATFGQFVYQDINPQSASGGLGINGLTGQNANNVFQLAWQGGFKYNFTTNTSAKVAAGIYQYLNLQRSSVNNFSSLSPYFGDPYVGEGANLLIPGNAAGYAGYGTSSALPGYGSAGYPINQVGLDNLLVLEMPFEFDFKIHKLDARVFGDFAYNLEGAQRAKDATAAYTYYLSQAPNSSVKSSPFSAQTHDVKAYQIGFSVASSGDLGLLSGARVRKHAWELSTFWQHTEQYALDPNIIDSDIFEGRENMQGICVALAYGFTDNLIGSVRYAHADRINDQLGTGGSNQDIPQMNPINSFDLFQVDLGVKF